ncbi:MAG: RNA ligase (ATP) [Pseudomonadota bacterium]
MSERKLASVQAIDNLFPIEGADVIECAQILGWKVVVKKGEFKVGDTCIYFEIDSFLPIENPVFNFLKNPITYEGTQGFRLKTIKLRGQVSQGLALPVRAFSECANLEIDSDVTELLGIKKWERQIPAQLAGQMKGNFPSFIRKTDQERIQNLSKSIDKHINGYEFLPTVKLDGSSMTVYIKDGEIGVCSRNIDLKDTEDNTFWRVAKEKNLPTLLMDFHLKTFRNIALQGELIGPGIQGNREKLSKHNFYMFAIFDIDEQEYLAPFWVGALYGEYFKNLDFVPYMSHLQFKTETVDSILSLADGPSLNAQTREGLVFFREDGKFSFKVISNQYLLKEE